MKHGTIWKISAVTSLEAEEAVTELFLSLFGEPPCVYANAETGKVTVTWYSPSEPSRWKSRRIGLRDGLKRIRDCGLSIGSGRVSVSPLKRENWAESWKRHFQPMEIGQALLIQPSWSKRQPRPGQKVVVLDPGLSFGTGHHATTGFCLREIVRRRDVRKRQSFLDVGTGSGILAIAAAKLGYSPVHAFDFDPEAVRTARANVQVNHLTSQVRIDRKDITRLPHQSCHYDLICANLISPLLVAQKHRIVRLLRPGGVLVLAGILKSEFAEVQKAFETMGLRKRAGRGEKEWYSGAFQRVGS